MNFQLFVARNGLELNAPVGLLISTQFLNQFSWWNTSLMLVYKFPFFTSVTTIKRGLWKFKVGHEDVSYRGPNVYENINVNSADCFTPTESTIIFTWNNHDFFCWQHSNLSWVLISPTTKDIYFNIFLFIPYQRWQVLIITDWISGKILNFLILNQFFSVNF